MFILSSTPKQAVALAVCFFLFACGSEGDAQGGFSFDSSFEDNAQLIDLSQSEYQDLCAETQSFQLSLIDDLDPFECRELAVREASVSGNDGALCLATEERCLEAIAAEPENSMEDCPPLNRADCSASVGEYELCMTDLGESTKIYVEEFPSCSEYFEGAEIPWPSLAATCRNVFPCLTSEFN